MSAWLLRGQVMHQRLRPVARRFVYPVFCLQLPLHQLAECGNALFGIDRWRALSVWQRDHGPADGSPLLPWIRRVLAHHGMAVADGDIWLQTFPRLFGYAFNPVSFWFCHDQAGQLRAVLAEVHNTFGERHDYLLSAPDHGVIADTTVLRCQKVFHVSPFCLVSGHYDFRIRQRADTSFVAIDYSDATGQLLLKTAIGARKTMLTTRSVLAALIAQPLLTLGVMARIHWQALLLWRAGVPVFSKPRPPVMPLTRSTSAEENYK